MPLTVRAAAAGAGGTSALEGGVRAAAGGHLLHTVSEAADVCLLK